MIKIDLLKQISDFYLMEFQNIIDTHKLDNEKLSSIKKDLDSQDVKKTLNTLVFLKENIKEEKHLTGLNIHITFITFYFNPKDTLSFNNKELLMIGSEILTDHIMEDVNIMLPIDGEGIIPFWNPIEDKADAEKFLKIFEASYFIDKHNTFHARFKSSEDSFLSDFDLEYIMLDKNFNQEQAISFCIFVSGLIAYKKMVDKYLSSL